MNKSRLISPPPPLGSETSYRIIHERRYMGQYMYIESASRYLRFCMSTNKCTSNEVGKGQQGSSRFLILYETNKAFDEAGRAPKGHQYFLEDNMSRTWVQSISIKPPPGVPR